VASFFWQKNIRQFGLMRIPTTLATYDPDLILLEVEWSGGSGSFSGNSAEILRMRDHTYLPFGSRKFIVLIPIPI
jgi:hypothetical protein